MKAHNIFDDYFGNRLFDWGEDETFKPIFQKNWMKNLDKMMLDEADEKDLSLKGVKDGETVKTSSVWTNKNGQESKKTVTTKKTLKNGRYHCETTEDYLLPNGEHTITKSINNDGKTDTKTYHLKKGEQVPKELCN